MPSVDVWKFIWSWVKWTVKLVHMLIGCLFPFESLREGLTYLQRGGISSASLIFRIAQDVPARPAALFLHWVPSIKANGIGGWLHNILGQSLCETTDEIGIDIVSDRLHSVCAIMVIAVITWVAIFNIKRKEVKKVVDDTLAGLHNDD